MARTDTAGQLPPDYHVHTKWCCHAEGEMRDYVEAALRAGVKELGFACHMPITIPLEEKIYLSREELPIYAEEFQRLKSEYAGRIDLVLGGECDFIPGQESEIEEVLTALPLDFLTGSVHLIDGFCYDYDKHIDRWNGRDVTKTYRQYYGLLKAAIRSGYFDIVGHFDRIKKFGFRPDTDITDEEAAVVEAVADAEMAVEINTRDLDTPAGELDPSERIMRMLYAKNVPIMFGSDAHRPQNVGRNFDIAVTTAKSIGWTSYVRFRGRSKITQAL